MEKRIDNRKNAKLSLKTHQKLKYCSDILNMPIGEFLDSLICQIWELLATFKFVDSMEYERSVLSNRLEIQVFGEKRLFQSTAPANTSDSELLRLAKKKFKTKDIFSLKLEEELRK